MNQRNTFRLVNQTEARILIFLKLISGVNRAADLETINVIQMLREMVSHDRLDNPVRTWMSLKQVFIADLQ